MRTEACRGGRSDARASIRSVPPTIAGRSARCISQLRPVPVRTSTEGPAACVLGGRSVLIMPSTAFSLHPLFICPITPPHLAFFCA